jgi:hypothetical protein
VSTLPSEPWRALPPEVIPVIRSQLPELRDEVLAVIAVEVAEYRRPFEGSFGRGIRRGVEEALGQFVDLIENPELDRAQSREIYRGLGRGEMRQGRSLDALQAAYRVGARVSWRRLAAAGLEAGLSPEVLCELADAIFAYIDAISADSVEGYAEAQEAAAGERERRRRVLVGTLLAESFDEPTARQAAENAGWELPRELALLALEPGDVETVARRLPPDAIPAAVDDMGCVLLPDPSGPGRRAELERACEGRRAALGPIGAPADALRSWRRARTGLTAIRAGALPDGLVHVDEHLAEIALFEARGPFAELAAHRLAPLDSLTPRARERMTETLRAFLEHRGNAAAMATALHLHPQTVRYRLRQLRDLFEEQLEDPTARFELELALRATNGDGPRSLHQTRSL